MKRAKSGNFIYKNNLSQVNNLPTQKDKKISQYQEIYFILIIKIVKLIQIVIQNLMRIIKLKILT